MPNEGIQLAVWLRTSPTEIAGICKAKMMNNAVGTSRTSQPICKLPMRLCISGIKAVAMKGIKMAIINNYTAEPPEMS
jgi:hypothetical protein